MARDPDDQPGNLWDFQEYAQARGEALVASGAIDRHPTALSGAAKARELLETLRAHKPAEPEVRVRARRAG